MNRLLWVLLVSSCVFVLAGWTFAEDRRCTALRNDYRRNIRTLDAAYPNKELMLQAKLEVVLSGVQYLMCREDPAGF